MKVLLVDDHPMILSALKAMIEIISPGVQVNALADAASALACLHAERDHDLALLDLQLGETDGFKLLAEVRSTYPTLPVVAVSESERASDIVEAIDMGAMGYLPKRMGMAELSEALRLVMAGGIYVPRSSFSEPQPGASHEAAESSHASAPGRRVRSASAAAFKGGGELPSLPSFEEFGITPRQADVLHLLLQAKPNKEIARQLNLSTETVKNHVQAVLRALGVATRTQAVIAVGRLTQSRGPRD